MFRKANLFTALVALAVALAGCTGGDEPSNGTTTPTGTTTTPTTTTPVTTTPVTPDGTGDANETPELTLNASGLPAIVFLGETFTFNLSAEGEGNFTSDHVGAHFGPNSTEEPTVPAYPRACPHQEGAVPGEFVVTCQIDQPGTYYLRGHVRLNESGTLHNFWTEEHTIVARAPVGEYDLTVTDAPALPLTPGQTFTFTLTVDGEATDFSDHVGGHFGTNTTEQPSVAQYPNACVHQEGEVPGEFTVECTVPANATPGTHYLRGHVRITVGGEAHNFWSDEHSFLVA